MHLGEVEAAGRLHEFALEPVFFLGEVWSLEEGLESAGSGIRGVAVLGDASAGLPEEAELAGEDGKDSREGFVFDLAGFAK